MIKSTRDYEIFKKHPSNRAFENSNLDKLKKSIQSRNLLSLRPILCDNQMRVIDGQHRLEVAKMLDLEIFYQVEEKIKIEDMAILNANQTTWSLEAWLHFYVSQEFEEYIKFKNFMEKNSLTIRTAMTLLSTQDGKNYVNFKKGTFKFPDGNRMLEVKETLDKIFEIKNLISCKTMCDKVHLSRTAFFTSLVFFFAAKSVEFDVFMKKLNLKLDVWHPCTTIGGYMSMLKDIYNYKNPHPITGDELRYN